MGHQIGRHHEYAHTKDYATVRGELLRCDERLGQHCVQITQRDIDDTFAHGEPISNWLKLKATLGNTIKRIFNNSWQKSIEDAVPLVSTVRNYKRAYVLPDVIAGLVAGAAGIPIGMSFAMIAGCEPQYGLYLQLLLPVCYFFFGTAEHLVMGVSAVEAMMAADAYHRITAGMPPFSEFARMNIFSGFAIFVGVNLLIIRLLGLGIIANFLSDAVVSGFSTACALSVGISQLPHAFGLVGVTGSNSAVLVWKIATSIKETNFAALAIMTMSFLLMWGCQALTNKLNSRLIRLPGAVLLLLIFIPLAFAFKIDSEPLNIKVVGLVPRGIPAPRPYKFVSMTILGRTYVQSLLYAIVYYFCHTSVSRSVARKKGYATSNNHELVAIGTSSIFCSFFSTVPIATSMSRTAIVCSEASTRAFNIVNFLVILLTLTLLTPALYYLPMPALAGLVLFSLRYMLSFDECYRLYKLKSQEIYFWFLSFGLTVVSGAMCGILVTVGLNLVWLVRQLAVPPVGLLGRLPKTRVFRKLADYSEAQETPGMKILYFEAPLYFCNAEAFERAVLNAAELERGDEIKVIIVDASCIHYIDVTALRAVENLALRLESHHKLLCFANWRGPVKRFCDRSDFHTWVPQERCFLSLHEAAVCAEKYFIPSLEKYEKQPGHVTAQSDFGPESIYPTWRHDHPRRFPPSRRSVAINRQRSLPSTWDTQTDTVTTGETQLVQSISNHFDGMHYFGESLAFRGSLEQ